MPKLNALIAGSTGYIGIQLVKLLIKHPNINVKYLCGNSSIGKSIYSIDKSIKYKKLPKIIKFNETIKTTSSVVIFGNFDGVHLGHQSLIDDLIKYGHNKIKILVTFHPHTQTIVKNNNSLKLITLYKEKLKLLSTFNIDYISTINFNKSFSKRQYESGCENRWGNRYFGQFKTSSVCKCFN